MPNLSRNQPRNRVMSALRTWAALFNGGTIGQVWSKDSSTDDDATWKSILDAMDDAGDYEVGSFTPSLSGTTGTPTVVYVHRDVRYQQIGDVCWVVGYVETSSFSGGSGSLTLTNFPFTSSSDASYRAIMYCGANIGMTYTDSLGLFMPTSSTSARFISSPSSGSSTLSVSDIAASSQFFFQGAYLL